MIVRNICFFFIICSSLILQAASKNPYVLSTPRTSRTRITRQHCCELFGQVLKECPPVRRLLCAVQESLLNSPEQDVLQQTITFSSLLCDLEAHGHTALDLFLHQEHTGIWSSKDKARLESIASKLRATQEQLRTTNQQLSSYTKQLQTSKVKNTAPSVSAMKTLLAQSIQHIKSIVQFLNNI